MTTPSPDTRIAEKDAEQRIAEIRARLAAATDGPWRVEHTSQGDELAIVGKCLPGDEDDDRGIVAYVPDMVEYANPEDAAFIANAPSDVTYLLDTYLPDQVARAVEAEREKFDRLLARCRDALTTAVYGDDGLDITAGEPLIQSIGEILGDSDDYEASRKCADDVCERCGEGGIRHVIKIARAKYDGVCVGCYSLEVAAIRARGVKS